MTTAGSSTRASADSAHEKFCLKVPSRAILLIFLREMIWISCLWFVVYGGVNWLTGLHDFRVRLWTDRELAIPFVPAAAAVYLSLFPMLWLSPLVLHTRDQLQSFARSLAWLIVLSGIGFLLFPGDQAYSQVVPAGMSGKLFTFSDQLNMSYNYLPSLHVGMAVVCAYAYSQTAPTKVASVFWLWAIAIAVSTLLTHQHYVADVVTGGVLGSLVAAKFVS